MSKTDPLLIEKCRKLRKRDFTLGEIVKLTQLPKNTVYYNIRDIPLSPKRKKQVREETIKRITEFNKQRKGNCIAGRVVPKPKGWSFDLIFLVAHFMFDGEIRKQGGCSYQNRSIVLINQMRSCMESVFRLNPIVKFYPETGVHRISYFYVELSDYMRKKSEELIGYIKGATRIEKGIFLRAFFDDEGCAYKWKNARKVRGFQQDLEMLRLVQKLLRDFDIQSKIDEKYKEIVISRKENLIKFRDKINFSKGIYINPDRKNSIWKKKLEKREILDRAIKSYIK